MSLRGIITEHFIIRNDIVERIILHSDCNSFFASVEASLCPELKKYAFAVCGNPQLRHGIILAKNEKAKSLGIKTGEAIWQAKQKCPGLILVKPSYRIYEDISQRIFNIYCRYTDLVEPFGIDECWLDVTGTMHLFGDGKKIADELRKTIKEEIGITISVGVSFNKFFAKMGSDYQKPDATTLISKENYKDILFPMFVGDMLFVGKATLKRLADNGIFTIGELANADIRLLSLIFGKYGQVLYLCANGMDTSPVKPSTDTHNYKSIGNGYTFKRDLVCYSDLRTGIFTLCDKVAHRLRKHKVECTSVQLSIKDTQLHSIQRQKTLQRPTQISYELILAVLELARDNWVINQSPIRSITVTGQNLMPQNTYYEQLSLFYPDEPALREKRKRIERVKDEIRRKYGIKALTMCSLIDNDLGL